MKYRRVIFVSTDNTCLGPAAESIFNRIAGGREIEAISRGLVVLFPEPMNAKMASVMMERGFEISKEFSEPLTKDDIVEQLKFNRGKQFDPKLVDVFLSILEDGIIEF